jgi:hypothetical protein
MMPPEACIGGQRPNWYRADLGSVLGWNCRKSMPAQTVDATLACSLLAGVWKPRGLSGTSIQAQRDLVELRL